LRYQDAGILNAKTAAYISMARPFIREPNPIKRWKGGEISNPKRISCNRCFETGMKGLGIFSPPNLELGITSGCSLRAGETISRLQKTRLISNRHLDALQYLYHFIFRIDLKV